MSSDIENKIEKLKEELGYDSMSEEEKIKFTREIRKVLEDLNETLEKTKDEINGK